MGNKKKTVWKKIYSEDGSTLVYEGYTFNGKPYGRGTVYYPDGSKYLDGVFDIKGLIEGKEYYENGQIRFDGKFRIHQNYGPNPPISGKLYNENGDLLFSGDFKLTYGGVGYPMVVEPKEYGPIGHKKVKFEPVMWDNMECHSK